MRRYTYTCDFVNTEAEAKRLCAEYNSVQTAYCRKKYPAHYTPWQSKDGRELKYIVWHVW